MIIDKIAINEGNFKRQEYYYNSARDGMFDLFNNMNNEGMINTVFLPGYIGWSPKEGSGIFDPINKIKGISVQYYKMTEDLDIDINDLTDRIANIKSKKFAVLIVNYFGFVDKNISDIIKVVKKHSGWIITDNAHGFFTYQCADDNYSDATFFSLHKMFPFKRGGSLVIINKQLKDLEYTGTNINETENNPWEYDIPSIIRARQENYMILQDIIEKEGNSEYFTPLKDELGKGNIPQTFPIKIKYGNRDNIYELMNEAGYGVVSLYHTLIEPLQCAEYQESWNLSKCIMNLPVHQDVDKNKFKDMIKLLVDCCEKTHKQ
ncbi:MAG: hypothetical protein WBI07_14740 [Mobilitalea sp.]